MAGAANKNERVQFQNVSASTLIKTGHGRYYGFDINSTSSGNLRIWDSTSATGTKIRNQFAPAIGSYMLNNGVDLENGLYVELVSGSIDITVYYA